MGRRWALVQWNQESWLTAEEVPSKAQPGATDPDSGRAGWYVNSQGQTLVVVPGRKVFPMGSPSDAFDQLMLEGFPAEKIASEETAHLRRINHTFAIAATETTVAQFQRFCEARGIPMTSDKSYSPSKNCPANTVSWFDAALYCNWLSELEGLEPCYEAEGPFGEKMKLARDFRPSNGYRLPTEGEWELACRAGTVTARYYGQTDELLGRYAWHHLNSQAYARRNGVMLQLRPVGLLMPNDFGLFDMLGNCDEWCFDKYGQFKERVGESIVDEDEWLEANWKANADLGGGNRTARGGSFVSRALYMRAANRYNANPAIAALQNRYCIGFRVARTIRVVEDRSARRDETSQ
jgi:eukaryotic-like serine/threonine-protein kinase